MILIYLTLIICMLIFFLLSVVYISFALFCVAMPQHQFSIKAIKSKPNPRLCRARCVLSNSQTSSESAFESWVTKSEFFMSRQAVISLQSAVGRVSFLGIVHWCSVTLWDADFVEDWKFFSEINPSSFPDGNLVIHVFY